MSEELSILGWTLRTFAGEEEPRIHEDELARRLGCDKNSVRRVFRRLLKGKILSDSNVRADLLTGKTGVAVRKDVTDWWFDEEAAVQIASDTQTDKGRALRKELGRVYIAYRRGQLVPVNQSSVVPLDAMQSTGESKPTSNLDLIERNLKNMVQLVGEVRVSRKIAEEALAQAEVNTRQIADLGGELATLAQQRQAALDSIPTLPPAQGEVAERTTRSNIVELLRWAAIHTETDYPAVAAKVHREFARRYGINFLARAKNESKRTRKKVSGLEMVERADECQRFYDLAVAIFGRPQDPLPPARGQAA